MCENSDKWFNLGRIPKTKGKNIFLFPYAGGGASVFNKWENELENCNAYALQYPGRENRISEKPIDDFNLLIENIYMKILPIISEASPYFLFGHSLGTKIIYELTLKLQREKQKLPSGLIVSAGRAPCYKENNPIYHLEDEDFIKELRRFSGTPEEVLSNSSLMKIFIPMLRADFKIDETYLNNKIEKVNCPILGLMGTKDSEMKLEELVKWRNYTTKAFKYKVIEGEHLFINTNSEEVLYYIKKFINSIYIKG